METEALDTSSSISSSTKTSSWPIVRGSIEDSVTFESSISALDSISDHIEPRKPPLILRRPSPDSGPCEITSVHSSTARVYEIYYAADEKCGNEYLCTVRCGLAAQPDEPVQVTDAVGSVPASYTDSNRCRKEGHSRTESGSSINEDGWVDVVPSGSDGRDSSLSNRNQSCSEKSNQDLFEATAEISDTDPVMSLTIRLLSIQSGDDIYIDEVYVYADPFVSEETDSSSNMPENSGSALMSMLVPTLLQLSKSRRNDSPATERIKSLGADHKSTVAATSSSAYQSERMPSSEIHGASVNMSQPQVPVQTQVPPHGTHSVSGENRFSYSHIERTLDELVSRISRIEHFCLRFEENMLKPISSMEARLEKVEQQLDSLLKNPLSCSRISPPECHDLKSNSTSVIGNDCHGSTKLDLLNNDASCQEVILVAPSEESVSANAVQHSSMPDLVKNDDCCYEVVAVPPLEAPSFVNGPQLHPSLVVTAPDFSSIDDDEENDVIEAVKESPKDTAKKPLSIDDALASALAGFLSLASTDPSECTHMVEETAKSPVERIVSNSSLAVMQDVEPAVPSVNINKGNEPISISLEEVAAVTEGTGHLATENNGEEKTKVLGLYHFSEEEDRNEPDCSPVDGLCDVDEDNIKDNGSMEELGCPEADDAASEPLGSDFSKTPAVVGSILLNDDSVGALELEGDNMDASSSEEAVKENPTLLRNILELPIPATVDFGIPILDVKFSSLENSSAKSLEALLVGMPESQNEIPCLREDSKSSSSEPTDLVVIEDGDSVACESANNQLFLGSYESSCLPSNTEERQQDPHDCSDQDMCASLI